MGIQAVKGVEIGDGFALARVRGSEAHDEIEPDLRRATNRAGGIEGGVTNGEPVVVRAAMKPLPTLMRPLRSVDLDSGEPGEALVERSDVQAVEALAVVAEAAVAWELARAAREKFGGDALVDFVARARRLPRANRVAARNALDRHLALVGFMGAGKSTLGPQLAERLGRRFVSVDELVEQRAGSPVAEVFAERGEPAFRELEEEAALDVARTSSARRGRARRGRTELGDDACSACSSDAFALHLETSAEEAWEPSRVLRSAARARPRSVRRALRAAAAAVRGCGRRTRDRPGRRDARRGGRPLRLASRRNGRRASWPTRVSPSSTRSQRRTPFRPETPRRPLPKPSASGARSGSSAVRRSSRSAAARRRTSRASSRRPTFAASTGSPVPSTLLGQVDAAIGGKTAIDLPEGKNLVGAFHWPAETIIDTSLLETLPDEERRNGLAEVVEDGAPGRRAAVGARD